MVPVPVVMNFGAFLKWIRDELRQMYHRTRKLTMHKKDIDGQYVSRKEGGRGHASTEHSMEASIQGFKDYIKKSKEQQITTARNSTNNIKTK